MAASRYEQALKAVYSACSKGPKKFKVKFVTNNSNDGVKGVIVCNNEFHALFFTPNGGCSFHNHDPQELHNLVTMDKLAHTKLDESALSGCALLMRGLKDIPTGQSFNYSTQHDPNVSAVFAKIKDTLANVGAARNKVRGASNHKEEGMLANITNQAKADIKELLAKLNYRKPAENAWNKPYNYKENNPNVPEPNDEGVSYEIALSANNLVPVSATSELWVGNARYRRDGRPQWVRFKAQLNLAWYIKVFRKGLAVIDGMLCLEHTKTFPNGLMLLKMVRQGYGFTVNTVPAVYDPVRNKLSWVNTESKAEALESGDKVPRRRRTKSELQGASDSKEEKNDLNA